MFDSTNWFGYVSAIMLIGVSFAAVFLGAKHPAPLPLQPSQAQLTPVEPFNVDPTFEGPHAYGLWTLICETVRPRTAEGMPPAPPRRICRTNAQARKQVGEQVLLAAGFNVLFVGPDKEPGVLFRLPPAASGSDHVQFGIDDNTMFQAPVSRCTPNECLVQGMLPAEALEQMKAGKKLTLIYTATVEQKSREVRVEQLLHGFPESFDALTKATGP